MGHFDDLRSRSSLMLLFRHSIFRGVFEGSQKNMNFEPVQTWHIQNIRFHMHFTSMLQNMVAVTVDFMWVFRIPMNCPSICQISWPWRRCLHPDENHLHDHASHHDHFVCRSSRSSPTATSRSPSPPSSKRYKTHPRPLSHSSHLKDFRQAPKWPQAT